LTVFNLTKGHAYGNDFLLTQDNPVQDQYPYLARLLCDRHAGIGADGLVLYTLRSPGEASMRLLNADGSWSELSGNGLRCLAAFIARAHRLRPGAVISIDSEAGRKTLNFLSQADERYTFRAAMGQPTDIQQVQIDVPGERVTATVLRTGNPQCVVLGPLPTAERFNALGPALATHAMFPAGTNVEFAHVEAPDRLRILIWERGVGPTSSSGTGSTAAAVAAAAHGGASRSIDVMAPGGTQHVDWDETGAYLTGWAELVFEGSWIAGWRGATRTP
jgi:diaminopimelate epimerase